MSVKTPAGYSEEEIPVCCRRSAGSNASSRPSKAPASDCRSPRTGRHARRHVHAEIKVRIGTELIATFPPERVMTALPPMSETAPRLAAAAAELNTPRKDRRSLFKLGG